MTAGTGERADDAELTARFRQDPQQFTEVHDRYFRPVYLYIAGRLDAQTAEDIAAETFLVAFDHRDRFDPGRGGLRPWLFGIATNLVARHRRREDRRYRALARTGVEPVTASHESRVVAWVCAQQMGPRVAQALTELSRGERDVLLLIALGQLSYDEVAQALGISPGTVGSRLTRARKKLVAVISKGAVDG